MRNYCISCGACCSFYRVSFYQGELLSKGKNINNKYITKLSFPYVCMKGTENGGKCVCLDGEVGGQISCSIYNERPNACRIFQPATERCNKARIAHNLSEIIPLVVINLDGSHLEEYSEKEVIEDYYKKGYVFSKDEIVYLDFSRPKNSPFIKKQILIEKYNIWT